MNQDDKQFMTQFMIVLGALLAFTVVIFIIARVLMSYNSTDYGPLVEKQVEDRTAPVGEAYSGEVPEGAQQASAGGGGEQTYAQVCSTCHDSGTAGAPKITDKATWQSRIEQGKQTLYDHAINGFNAMPPKGGDPSLSDEQVQAAVDHIVETVGGGASGKQQSAKASAKSGQSGQGQPRADQAQGAPPKERKQSAKAGAAGAAATGIKQAAARGASAENESIYQAMCSACHASGALGAPKVTDKVVWKARIAKGPQALYGSAISGIGAMPPKGGHSQLSEEEVKKAVDYIIAQVSGADVAGNSGGAKQQPARPAASSKSSAAGKATPSSQARGGDAQGKQTDAKGAAAADGQQGAKSGETQRNAGAAAGGASLAAGKKTYDSVCATCHATGMAGVPKYGDKAAWASRVKMGKAQLHQSAINGKGAMPPKGGNPQLSDGEVKAAVDYMLNAVQ